MKDRLTRPGGRVLMVLLIGSLLTAFAGAGLVMAQDADPVRALPEPVVPGDLFQVTPGGEFEVKVTFTSPADAFNAIGLTDVAPAGWTVTVDKTWCTPEADWAETPQPEEAVYIWYGPAPPGTGYAAGVEFEAVYWVRVPDDAALGTYTFPGRELEFYIAETGPFVNPITGPNQVEVVESISPPVGGTAHPISRLPILALWIALGAAIVGGASLLMRRRRATR